MKSIEMDSKGSVGVGKGFSFPTGFAVADLLRWQLMQVRTHRATSAFQPGHQKDFSTCAKVRLTPGCPAVTTS
jgi:hypothetical protein